MMMRVFSSSGGTAFYVWWIVGGLTLCSLPTKVWSLTRKEAIARATKANPAYIAVTARARIARRKLEASRLFPTNPEVEGAGKAKLKSPSGLFPPAGAKSDWELSWKLPIGGRWGRAQNIARRQLLQVQEEIQITRFLLELSVHRAYNHALIAKAQEQLAKELRDFYQRIYNLTKQRQQRGALSMLELNFARVELLQSQVTFVDARLERRLKQQKLMQLLGWPATRPVSLTSPIPSSFRAPRGLSLLQRNAERAHVKLRLLRRIIDTQKAVLAFAHAKAIPDLKLKLYYSWESDQIHTVGGGFAIPLPFIQRNQSKIWTSRAKLRQLRIKFRAERFDVRQKVVAARTRYLNSLRVFKLFRENLVPIVKQQRELSEKGFRLGTYSIIKVITSQQSQNKALQKRLKVHKQALDDYLDLCESTGARPVF